MANTADPFDSNTRLRPEHAVAALLRLADGRYVMQLRDTNPAIFYPDHWGCFGGAVESGERPEQAIVRELGEELNLKVSEGNCVRFTEFTFDFGFAGYGQKWRIYYEVILSATDLSGLVLSEGAEMDAFEGKTLLAEKRIVPYDAFAIWMHFHQSRIADVRCTDR